MEMRNELQQLKKDEIVLEKCVLPEYQEHSTYRVTNDDEKNISIGILLLFYGNLWEFALDRVDHQLDGYLFTIQHNGHAFKIYRILDDVTAQEQTPLLRLVKPSKD
jgi:hypothetical protein